MNSCAISEAEQVQLHRVAKEIVHSLCSHRRCRLARVRSRAFAGRPCSERRVRCVRADTEGRGLGVDCSSIPGTPAGSGFKDGAPPRTAV